jgi:mannosyltransferase OCH1-like enzyme
MECRFPEKTSIDKDISPGAAYYSSARRDIMIPHLIHQTWKTDAIPDRFRELSRSWIDRNSGWTHILWSDRMLLDFVAAHYPEMMDTYCSYQHGVQRADAARYMLLHHFGGIYADIDTECLDSLEPLASENRIVLCHEPPSHWPVHAPMRGLPLMLFNGVMASPAGHPFWRYVIDRLPAVACARNVLDSTGPLLLTALARDYPDQAALVIHSCHLFNSIDTYGKEAPDYDGSRPNSLARHYWSGTWYEHWRPHRILNQIRLHYHKARNYLTRGSKLDPAKARTLVDPAVLKGGLPKGDAIAVLVPLRDAAEHIAPFLDVLSRLAYPKHQIKLVFCEGDSRDDTFERLSRLTAPLRDHYRDIVILRHSVGHDIPHETRWMPKYQRVRRAGIAKVRNALIDGGLGPEDDWALWIDIDVWNFPPDIIQQLRAANARIVTPNCVVQPGGVSFDLGSFVTTKQDRDWEYYSDMRDGLHQPPMGYVHRLYLSDVRYLDRIVLDSVGGTMLLVDAALHRGGLLFPELPYDDLIETEGFGALARDLGIEAIGLPKVEIMHVPW